MQNIWEQQSQEPDKKYGYFKLFLEFESTNLKDFADSIGESYSQIRKHSSKFKWMDRRAAYQAFKAAEGVADSATTITEDLVTAALVLGHVINPAPAEVAENETGENLIVCTNLAPVQHLRTETDTSESSTPSSDTNKNLTDTAGLVPLETALTVAGFFTPPAMSFEEQIKEFKAQPPKKIIDDIKNFSLLENISKIEIGKRLIALKETANYGDWQNFIKENFYFSYTSATRYMQIAKRYANLAPVQHLPYYQQLALLSLPEGEEENFLAEMDAQGNPYKDMNKQQAISAVDEYKAKIESLKAENEKLQAENERLQAENEKAVEDLAAAQNLADKAKAAAIKVGERFTADMGLEKEHAARLQDRLDEARADLAVANEEIQELKANPVTVEIETKIIPPDYEDNKKALAESQEQILKLQAQIDAAPAENQSLQSRVEAFAKLAAAADILSSLDNSALKFVEDFAAEYPDKFARLAAVANFKTDNGD